MRRLFYGGELKFFKRRNETERRLIVSMPYRYKTSSWMFPIRARMCVIYAFNARASFTSPGQVFSSNHVANWNATKVSESMTYFYERVVRVSSHELRLYRKILFHQTTTLSNNGISIFFSRWSYYFAKIIAIGWSNVKDGKRQRIHKKKIVEYFTTDTKPGNFYERQVRDRKLI